MANGIAPTGGPTILSHPIFLETILPFILVFTVIFAVLQKSKLLGDGKKQIDAIVALVIGLILVSFAQAINIINPLIVFLSVSLVIILVFMLLLGSFMGSEVPKKLKYVLMVVVAIAVVIAVLIFTGAWQYLTDLVYASGGVTGSGVFLNILFVIIIAGAIVAVILGGGKGSSSDKP